jgi:predicted membrane channel-forming protein YqfA (hemolysin III family)
VIMPTQMDRRLRVSALLIMLGLLVEALSLIRIHPLAFLVFMFVGGALLIAGIALYLFSIVSESSPSDD